MRSPKYCSSLYKHLGNTRSVSCNRKHHYAETELLGEPNKFKSDWNFPGHLLKLPRLKFSVITFLVWFQTTRFVNG